MRRSLHSLPALAGALFVVVLAVSGAIMSLQPAFERLKVSTPAPGELNIAELAAKVQAGYPGVEQIDRLPSGALVVYYSAEGEPGADLVDPTSGTRLGPYAPSAFFTWMRDLHRAFLLNDPGRAAVGITAAWLALLALSGLWLLASGAGGWRKLLHPVRGGGLQRLHASLGRLALLGLLFSALSGAWLGAVRFEWIQLPEELEPDYPEAVDGGPPAPVGSLAALQGVDLHQLQQLLFPFPDSPEDVYTLRTRTGAGYIDQSTGQWLAYTELARTSTLQTLIMELHTGERLWWLGLLLGTAALSVPVLAWTGTRIWWQRRRSRPRIADNCPAPRADTLLLVGSETNSTWGFASALQKALREAGCLVHVAAMNDWPDAHPAAQRLFILAATYGDGDAPASAARFLEHLPRHAAGRPLPWAVLGFGDRQFPGFCGYAVKVDAALRALSWPQLLPTEFIDRQSAQAFAQWGTLLGKALGLPLTLQYEPLRPPTRALRLSSREDYGSALGTPVSILRFQPASGGRALPRFVAGDLVGILPPGSPVPRFYSLASATADGVVEICVRRHERGVCSRFLCDLALGGQIDAFIQPNPRFHPQPGRTPLILIGAGTGIAPLIGFIRANKRRRPVHLYWGGRLATSDFLYEHTLQACLDDGRLSRLRVAFSRAATPEYVQDLLLHDGDMLRSLLQENAQVLVCGGRPMATDVAVAMDALLLPLGLTVQALRSSDRYLEDTY